MNGLSGPSTISILALSPSAETFVTETRLPSAVVVWVNVIPAVEAAE
jgi:hypothetical protein